MDKVVQQNAANAEESAAAAQEMSAQSEDLCGFVNELSGLVRGDEGQNGGETISKQDGQPSSAQEIPGAPIRHLKNKIRKVLSIPGEKEKDHGQSGGHDPEAAMRKGKRTLSPVQALPLDDEDFKQF